jgi:hypothetical protein
MIIGYKVTKEFRMKLVPVNHSFRHSGPSVILSVRLSFLSLRHSSLSVSPSYSPQSFKS